MKHLLYVFIFLAALLLAAILTFQPDHTLKYVGRMDANLIHLIESNPKLSSLEINSGGGSVQDSSVAAELLMKKDVKVIVRGRCLSSCSEFILPAATKVSFLDRPVIGFHWSPWMDFNQYERHKNSYHNCPFDAAKIQRDINVHRELNLDFWKQIESRLELVIYRLHENGSTCPDKERGFLNRTWLPTSQQMRDLWGLEFKGQVCADHPTSCIEKVDAIWDSNTKIVIGDQLHIVP